MSSIETQFLNIKAHHAQYSAIDPKTILKGSASGKIVFITGASQGIGQATAIAFAQAGAKAVYITARSEKALEETRARVKEANPETQCAYRTHLTSFPVILGFEASRYSAINDRGCLAKPFSARK